MQTIWIEDENQNKGLPYHARYTDAWYDLSDEDQQKLLDSGCESLYYEPILGEDGEPIPKKYCLCAAHSDDECICGAYTGNYDEYFSDEYKGYEE